MKTQIYKSKPKIKISNSFKFSPKESLLNPKNCLKSPNFKILSKHTKQTAIQVLCYCETISNNTSKNFLIFTLSISTPLIKKVPENKITRKANWLKTKSPWAWINRDPRNQGWKERYLFGSQCIETWIQFFELIWTVLVSIFSSNSEFFILSFLSYTSFYVGLIQIMLD